ncbi:MAG: hypothetical protein JWM64_1008 [Frankiales bacterium]|nr:hypothetical protein [Frankiales bacterium]
MGTTDDGTASVLDDLVALAARLVDAPGALLVLDDRTIGWPEPAAAFALLQEVAASVRRTGRSPDGRCVGVPVPGAEGGPAVGALCVLDPRPGAAADVCALQVVATAVGARLELAAARADAVRAAARLERLATVALELGAVHTLERLTDVVVGLGLPVLGADGGAVLVREEDQIRLLTGAGLGPDVQQIYGTLPLDSPLPAAVVTRTGQHLVLRDRAAGAAFDGPLMEQVYADTGCLAWAFTPLVVGGTLLGSLAIAWREEREEVWPDELELFDAFAAQCAAAVARVLSTEDLRRRELSEREQRQREAVALQAESAALALLAGGAPVTDVLPALAHWVELSLDRTRCTVALAHDERSVPLPRQHAEPPGCSPCPPPVVACLAVPVTSPASGALLGTLVLHREDPELLDDAGSALVARACHLVGIAVDRQHLLARLDHQARHDALTGLANRRRLLEALDDDLGRGDLPVVVFLDLDGLKAVNDSLGHEAGDALLVEVAARLAEAAGPEDLVSRFGGDEFVVLVRTPGDVDELAARLLDAVAAPRDGCTTRPRASAGVVTARPGQTAGDLVRAADLAMYRAKTGGGGRHVVARHVVDLTGERLRRQHP